MKGYLLIFLFSLVSFASSAQDIQAVLKKADTYSMNNPQEKLYLHLDKYAYAAGETIWFKSYGTVGIQNFFSGISGIAYVELISPSKEIVNSLTIPMMMGVGMGDIVLSDTITEGSYRLRAYTKWMQNAGENYFYDRTIHIGNGRSDNVMTKTSVKRTNEEDVYKIALTTLSGVSLGNIKVSYDIVQGGKSVGKKKINADEMGVVTIPVEPKYQNAIVNLKFENLDKKSVHKQIKLSPAGDKITVTLFPEGGKLFSDRINNIGIKSVNSKGLGTKVKLQFFSGNDTIGTAETNELGMGATSLYLLNGVSLRAEAMLANGTKVSVPVPAVNSSGYSLKVNNMNPDKLYAQIALSSDLIDQSELYFVVHHIGQVIFVSKQKVNKEEIVFTLDKKKLPNGISTISVFNGQFVPIAERPIFHHNISNELQAQVTFNKPNFTTRDKVEVEMTVGNASDSLRIGAFSAAVLDLSKIKDDYIDAPTIVSTLLLSSDLKGYIEKPGYYFKEGKVNTQDLDYLMLTQGWRNINWVAMEEEKKPQYTAEKALTISGYTKKLGRSKAEPKANIQLISTKSFMDFIDTTSNDEGYFEFNNLLFPDSVKFLISAKTAEKGKNNIDIEFNQRKVAEIGENRNEAEVIWDVNREYSDEIKNLKQYFAELESKGLKEKAIAIEEVVVTRERPKAAANSSNLNGPGNADQVIAAADLSTCITLEMCLAGRLMGVTWQAGIPYNTRGNVPMQVVLDGMFIESDQISMINTADVESVEVLRNGNYTAIYGLNGGNGLIIITSKTGLSAMKSNVAPKGLLTIQPQGVYVNKTFYKPEYDVADGLKFVNDVRTTIHWESSLVTDKEGKAKFNFFTPDTKGKYLITIEGVDLNGRLLHKQLNITVQ